MKYAITIGDRIAELDCSDDMTIEQLEVAKEMLCKAVDTRIIELKSGLQNKLPLTADIDSLYPELTVRARNVLKRNGCNTIEDVLNCTPTDLKKMRNMSKRSFEEIKERFSKYGTFMEGMMDEDRSD